MCAYDIVLVMDDSGSMSSATEKGKTRWSELQEVARIAVEIGCALDESGVDVLFLNREGARGVRSWKEADALFKSYPSGSE